MNQIIHILRFLW